MKPHPFYSATIEDWLKWRLTYEGGEAFITQYLRRLSKRESIDDFNDRKAVTYCPPFAKTGINEIKDSIYQRMNDITRAGGSKTFENACSGLQGGVDLVGSSMDYFIGCEILPELLVMKKVGIYVDMPNNLGESLLENQNKHPYLYSYHAENIINWICDTQGDFTAIVLQEYYERKDDLGFTVDMKERYRYIKKVPEGIAVTFHIDIPQTDGSVNQTQVDQEGNPSDEIIILNLPKIPFIVCEISESLMTDIANYQIALLNLASTDMAYALKSNYPFYVEQRDPRTIGAHLKPANQSGEGPSESGVEEIKTGITAGRAYAKGLNEPNFINPSPEPLQVSMEKQTQLKEEIRQILKLTLANIKPPKMASAESKQQDSRSLETGLSYIGLTLENTERKIVEFWDMYEKTNNVATIIYPENYSLLSEADRRGEAKDLQDLMDAAPSITFKKSLAKRISNILLGAKSSKQIIAAIDGEIDAAVVIQTDAATITMDWENGFVSDELASKIRGYPEGEIVKAKADHAERLARISDSQARGVPDLGINPKASSEEKENKPKRGEGK